MSMYVYPNASVLSSGGRPLRLRLCFEDSFPPAMVRAARRSPSTNSLIPFVPPPMSTQLNLQRDKPITRRFVEGIDLCEDTDLSRFDHISRGSSSCGFTRPVLLAVEGRELAIIVKNPRQKNRHRPYLCMNKRN